MSNELDELFAELDGSRSKKSPKPAVPQRKPASSGREPATNGGDKLAKIIIAVASFVGLLVVVGLIVLMVNVGRSGQKPASESPSGINTADFVKGHSSVLDNLESIKDSQIRSLNEELAALEGVGKNKDNVLDASALIASVRGKDAKVVDTFLARLYALKNTSSAAEIEVVREDISAFMTDAAATKLAYSLVTGATPAKQLAANGVTSPSVLLNLDQGAAFTTYVVLTPFTTEADTVFVQSVVTLEGRPGADRKISYAAFTGVVDSTVESGFSEALTQAAEAARLAGKRNVGGEPSNPDGDAGAASEVVDGGGVNPQE